VKVAITRGGGLAGVSQTTELDSSGLPENDTARLAALVDGLAEGSASKPHPDEQSYELVVTDDDGDSRTFHYLETQMPAPAQDLIAWVQARPERQTRFNRPS
jgi:hypothetical protein